jgi:hypothetical protein
MVEIDVWGRFPFVLAYLTDGKELGRFLVRGHARTTPADLIQSIQLEVRLLTPFSSSGLNVPSLTPDKPSCWRYVCGPRLLHPV